MQEGQDWVYSEKVKDHFLNPRNFLMGDESQFDYDAVGQVGNPICGDQMRMYIKVGRSVMRLFRTCGGRLTAAPRRLPLLRLCLNSVRARLWMRRLQLAQKT